MPWKWPPAASQGPFPPLASVLAVSWAHSGFSELQATSHTTPANSQGVTLGDVVPSRGVGLTNGAARWRCSEKPSSVRSLCERSSRGFPQERKPSFLLTIYVA